MPLPYRRMSQVPDSLIHHISTLMDAGYYLFAADSRGLRRKIMDVAARLEPGESAKIALANIYFADETVQAPFTLSMNDKQKITWTLELP